MYRVKNTKGHKVYDYPNGIMIEMAPGIVVSPDKATTNQQNRVSHKHQSAKDCFPRAVRRMVMPGDFANLEPAKLKLAKKFKKDFNALKKKQFFEVTFLKYLAYQVLAATKLTIVPNDFFELIKNHFSQYVVQEINKGEKYFSDKEMAKKYAAEILKLFVDNFTIGLTNMQPKEQAQQIHEQIINHEKILANEHVKESSTLYESFITQCGYKPEQLYEQRMQEVTKSNSIFSFKNYESFAELSPKSKDAVLLLIAQNLLTQIHKLEVSAWHPNQGIRGLMNELREKGPSLVGISFGIAYYPDNTARKAPGFVKSKIPDQLSVYNHVVYKFNEDDYKNSPNAHTCLLVGAMSATDKNGKVKDTVYLIDVANKSELTKPVEVYELDYKLFESRLCSHHGKGMNDKPAEVSSYWQENPHYKFLFFNPNFNDKTVMHIPQKLLDKASQQFSGIAFTV